MSTPEKGSGPQQSSLADKGQFASKARPSSDEPDVERSGRAAHLIASATARVRIDRWLSAARIFSSRTQAQDACEGGHVKLNGQAIRASHLVRPGDKLEGLAPRGRFIVVVLALEEKRQSPPRARELYEDHSPPPEPRVQPVFARDRGTGRPTKADRRRLSRLRGID